MSLESLVIIYLGKMGFRGVAGAVKRGNLLAFFRFLHYVVALQQ